MVPVPVMKTQVSPPPIAGMLGAGLAEMEYVPVTAPVEGGANCDKFAATIRLLVFPCPSARCVAGPRRKGTIRRNADETRRALMTRSEERRVGKKGR